MMPDMQQDHRRPAVAAFLYARRLLPEDTGIGEINHMAQMVLASVDSLVLSLRGIEDPDMEEETMQAIYYDAGKMHFSDRLRWWFSVLYEMLLRQKEGPRLGQFTRIMTPEWVSNRLEAALINPWA